MSTESTVGELDVRKDTLKGRVREFVNDHIALVMLGPPLAVIGIIFVYPVIWMFFQSLFMTVPGLGRRFAPLYNYQQMFTSPTFWGFFKHTLVYSFGSLIMSFSGGMAIALALNHVKKKWLRTSYTTLILFSWALPLAVVALTWRWILNANPYGLANMILLDLGLINQSLAFLSNQKWAMYAVTIVDAWLRMPFAMIVFLAGLQSIPQHMYDAAKVDGATTFQTWWNVTLPYLRPYMAIVGLINWMFAFRAFSIIYPMTQGGPGTRTTTLAIEIYRRGMVRLNFGYGSAIAVFLVAITLVLAVFYVTVVLQRIEE